MNREFLIHVKNIWLLKHSGFSFYFSTFFAIFIIIFCFKGWKKYAIIIWIVLFQSLTVQENWFLSIPYMMLYGIMTDFLFELIIVRKEE